MAAGSVIAAMAGDQSLTRWAASGARCPSPSAASSSAAWRWRACRRSRLLLQGRDPRLVAERGGWHWALYVVGYIGAFLTAVYTFRMIFRAFWGEPCPEARELEEGHIHHPEEPFNPATGEEEDTDVGFPGPEHHIAERALPMKVAMGLLAVGATVGGLLQIPNVDEHRQVPGAELRRLDASTIVPPNGLEPSGSSLGGGSAWRRRHRVPELWVTGPGHSGSHPRALAPRSTAVRQQVVLRRAHRRGVRAPRRRRSGASRSRPSSAWSSTACWSAARPAWCARARPPCGACRTATCATTPRCCSSAWPASPSTSCCEP